MPSLVPMRGVRMSDDLYLKLKFLAAKDERSYNQQAVYILKRYVEEYEKKNGEIVINPDALYE